MRREGNFVVERAKLSNDRVVFEEKCKWATRSRIGVQKIADDQKVSLVGEHFKGWTYQNA